MNSASSQKLPSSSKNTVAWIAFVLALASLAMGGFVWYENMINNRLQTSQQSNRIDTLSESLARLEQGQTMMESRISQAKGTMLQTEETVSNQVRAIRKEMIDQQATISEQLASARNIQQKQAERYREDFAGLSESIVKLGSDLGQTANDWGVEEAGQLIFIANQRLQLSGETDLAIRALTLADGRLEAMGNPELIEVRRLLVEDIALLEKVEKPDYLGTLAAIESLLVDLDKLPLPGDIETIISNGDANTQKNTSDSEESGVLTDSQSDSLLDNDLIQSFVNAGKVFFADLGDLIQIEKNGKPVDPIISSEVKFMTLEKTRLILESAQSAYLRQQFDIYQQRLLSAGSWVENRFVSSEQRDRWLEELATLSSNVSTVELPDASASLEAIRAIIDR